MAPNISEFTTSNLFLSLNPLKHPILWLLSLGTCALQVYLFSILFFGSDDDGPLYVSEVATCTSGVLSCVDEMEVDDQTYLAAYALIALHSVLPGLVISFHCARNCKFLAAVSELAISVIALGTALKFIYASAQTDGDVILNSLAVMFIADLDEKVFSTISFAMGGEWVAEKVDLVDNKPVSSAVRPIN